MPRARRARRESSRCWSDLSVARIGSPTPVRPFACSPTITILLARSMLSRFTVRAVAPIARVAAVSKTATRAVVAARQTVAARAPVATRAFTSGTTHAGAADAMRSEKAIRTVD